VPVIAAHPTRAGIRKTARWLYEERAGIACLFGTMKHLRRVFNRLAELARRYLAFVHLVAACILLR